MATFAYETSGSTGSVSSLPSELAEQLKAVLLQLYTSGTPDTGWVLLEDEVVPGYKSWAMVDGLSGGTPWGVEVHHDDGLNTISFRVIKWKLTGAVYSKDPAVGADGTEFTIAYTGTGVPWTISAYPSGFLISKMVYAPAVDSTFVFGIERVRSFTGTSLDQMVTYFMGSTDVALTVTGLPVSYTTPYMGTCMTRDVDNGESIGPMLYTTYYDPTGAITNIVSSYNRPDDGTSLSAGPFLSTVDIITGVGVKAVFGMPRLLMLASVADIPQGVTQTVIQDSYEREFFSSVCDGLTGVPGLGIIPLVATE